MAGKIQGIDYADIAKVNTIAKASIEKINGVDVSGGGSTPFGGHATLGTDIETYYNLNSDADDSTANANDGTVNGATGGVTGKIGNCYSFDGTNDYIDTNFQLTGITQISFSYWYKRTNTTQTVFNIFGVWTNTNAKTTVYNLVRCNEAYKNRFLVGYTGSSAKRIDIQGTITDFYDDTDWHHVVFTADTSSMTGKVYLDGVEKTGSMTDNSGATSFTMDLDKDFYIGALNYPSGGVYNFNGLIDEVGVWSKILTQSEVTDLYNSGSGLTY